MSASITFEGSLHQPSGATRLQLAGALRQFGVSPGDFIWKTIPPDGTLQFRLVVAVEHRTEPRLPAAIERLWQVAGVRDVRWAITHGDNQGVPS
jgi:hypothetical protein